MSCAPLASTGVLALALIEVGAVLLVAGAVLVLLTRGRRAGTATGIVMLLLISGGLTTGVTGSSAANAPAPSCAAGPKPNPSASASVGASSIAENSLTIVQTSTMTGIAPGIAPMAITGTVTNRAPTSTFVTAVTVSVAGVTEALGATAGTCDASDYVLFDPAMPVGRTLAPGESLDFAGARIGFSNKPLNQDACQSAAISLHYVSS